LFGTIKRIKKYKMLKSFISPKNIEPILSLSTALLFIFVLHKVNFYDNFSHFLDISNNICLCIVAGLFGIIGFSLSGISIIVSLFTKQDAEIINKYNNKKTLTQLMSGYEFLAFHSAINIVVMFIFYILINSNLKIAPKGLFYFLIAGLVYFVFFDIYYMCSLVGNCIKLHEIKCAYEKINELERSILDNANEIRIDLLLTILANHTKIDINEILDELERYIDESTYTNKEDVKNYIKAVYGRTTNE